MNIFRNGFSQIFLTSLFPFPVNIEAESFSVNNEQLISKFSIELFNDKFKRFLKVGVGTDSAFSPDLKYSQEYFSCITFIRSY